MASIEPDPAPEDGIAPLRRPNPETISKIKTQEEKIKSTQLNADAKEYIPVTRKSTLNVNCAEFFPQHNASYTVQSTDYPQYQRLNIDRSDILELQDIGTDQDALINGFKQLLFNVTSNPSLIDDGAVLNTSLDMLLPYLNDAEFASQIVHLIIEQGILEQNFRYTGGRICSYLVDGCHSFRQLLLQSLKNEFHNKSPSIQRKHGYLLFIGELFCLLKTNKGEPYVLLSTAIYDYMINLLNQPTEENLRCICNTLKLTGPLIDDFKDAKDFQPVYDQLSTLVEQSHDKNLKRSVDHLLAQHDANWGRGDYGTAANNPHLSEPDYQFQNEPVFYGVDNQPISREAAGYNIDYNINNVVSPNVYEWETTSQHSYNGSSSGMDSEAERLFEQFLAEQHPPTQYNAL